MISRRSRTGAQGEGDPAVVAAVAAARTARFSDSSTLVRVLEDGALAVVDPSAARRLTAVDRVFDRRFAELSRDYERRLDLLESESVARPVSSGFDVLGMLAALTGTAMLLAGGPAGPAIPLGGASIAAVALITLATAAHAFALLLARPPSRTISHGWSLVIVSAVGAAASAAWIGVRMNTVDQGLDGTPSIVILGAFAAVLLVSSAVAGYAARGRGRAADSGRRRRRELAAEFEPEVAKARAIAVADAADILESLPRGAAARMDDAVRAAVRELKKSETYHGTVLDPLLSSPRFSSRYDEKL